MFGEVSANADDLFPARDEPGQRLRHFFQRQVGVLSSIVVTDDRWVGSTRPQRPTVFYLEPNTDVVSQW